MRALSIVFLALIALSQVAAAQVSLSLGDASVAAGQSATVNATISTDGSAVALQFDVLYDPAIVSLGTVNGGPALSGNHSISSNPISPGRDRIVITTLPVSALNSGTLAIVNFSIAGGAAAGSTPLNWGGVVISDASALPITPSALIPGTITITAAAVNNPPQAIPSSPVWSLLLLIGFLVIATSRMARRMPVAGSLSLAAMLLVLVPLSHAQTLPGDANGDGRIDIEDVRLIVERILERGTLPGDGDCNRDSIINVLDTVCSQIPFVPGETAPIILGPGNRSIPASTPFTMNLFAVDPDAGSTLSWELLSGPTGLSVSGAGVLTWTPAAGDAGANPVTVRVTDDTARTDEASFTITVTVLPAPPAANAPPVLTVPGSQSLLVGAAFSAQASATDPDPGDTLTYRLIDGPAGMSIDPDTGALSWTPQANQARTADVVVEVSDAAGAADFDSFTVTATEPNAAPTAVDDVYIARKGETLTIAAPEGVIQNDSDPNDDPLSATRLSNPSLGTIDSFGADGSFSYTPAGPSPTTIGLEFKCETNIADFGVGTGTSSAADVDGDGRVELVGFSNTILDSRVYIVDPTDCSAQVIPLPEVMGQASHESLVTLVNLDDDPELEIVAPYFRFASVLPDDGSPDPGNRLMAVNLDGSPVAAWPLNGLSESPAFLTAYNGEFKNASPVAVDLNGDGISELVAAYTQVGGAGLPEGTCRAVRANSACNAVVAWDGRTGRVLWSYVGGVTVPLQRSMSPTLVDLDMDGDTEIIWNQLVLDHEGNLVFELPVERTIWVADFVFYGNDMLTVAVANFDNDPFPEIVGYDASNFYLFSHDGSIQWQRPYRGSGFRFPYSDLALAELDGDPFPEMVTMLLGDGEGPLTLRAFDSDGEPLWDNADEFPVNGRESHSSSPVAFDLDGDGIDEIIQFKTDTPTAHTSGLYILDGRTGDVITSIVDPALGRSYAFGDEPLTVADIDGDGSAEIVTNFNREFGFDRLNIWDNLPGEPFPPARPIRSQTNLQPSWVDTDGNPASSLAPHWLQPGRNYWNRIVPDRDPLAPEQDSFTYRVSDGEFDSGAATVNIELRPAGNPPFFLSEADTATGAGVAYRYQPLVVDVDPGDTVTFELIAGPAGMTMDPATGALDWLPESTGEYPVSLAATDSLGLSSAQIFRIAVGNPMVVPDVVGGSEAAAAADLTAANLTVGDVFVASHPTIAAGLVLEQEPPAGSVANFGDPVTLTLSAGAGAFDRDDDGDGYSENQGDCNDDNNAIFPGAADGDGDGIDQDCDGIDGNKSLVSIDVAPAARRVISGQPVPLVATGIFDDGTAQNLTAIASWNRGPTFISNTAGDFTATANFRGVTGSADFEVVARIEEDIAPIARIFAPANGDVVTAPTEVIATARDDNLLRYELAYRPVDEASWTVIGEETFTRVEAPIATFDPSLLLNGLYEIRLRVFDRGGNVSEYTTTVRVEGQLKVGNFTLRYVDLELPFNGIPITIARSYDSRDKRTGDFGVGWRLGVNSIEVRSNRELGTGWRVNRQGLTYSLDETDPHLVAVRFPSGEIEAFRMVVTPEVSPIVPFPPFSQSVRFEALPGTLGTLESLEANNVSILDAQPGTASLRLDSNGDIYDPTLFRYRSPDGVIVDVDIVDGIQRAETPGGQVLTFSAGSIRHSNGREVQLDRDAVGRITRITDPEGFSQVYSYDANGDLRSHEDQEGFVTRFDYDGSHNIIRIFDPLGRPVARNEYDAAGRLIRNTNVDGGVTEFDHDVVGRQEVITNPDGSTTVMEFDDRGNVLRYTDALGNTTTNTYDERNNQLTTTNALGETITRTFDEHNNLLTETDPLGNTKRYEYDSRDKLIRFTDALGRVATFAFDTRGNLLEQSDPLGNTVSYEYDSNGNLLSIENARGDRQRFSYDAFGNQLSMTDARGNTERFSYNANGEPVSSTTRRGITVTVNLDGRGLPTGGTDPVGRPMSFVFGATRALSEVTDPAGNTTVFATDADDKELAYTDPLGNRTEKRYDPRGQLTELEDPAGNTTLFAYDDVERPVRTTLPDGAQTQTRYDAAGRVSEVEDALGNVTRYAYDAAGRNTRVTDALGNVTEYAYDAAGQLVAMTDARGEVFEYHYDGAGRRTRTLYPDGSFSETGYDELGQVISETDALGRVTQYRYDANGNLTRVTDPLGGTTNFLYDADDQLIARLDALGHRTSFRYDDFGRLVEMVYPDGSRETRSYDAAGNIAAETDPNGRTTTYEYDADGRIVRKAFGDGTEEQFTYRHTDQILAATNAQGTVRHEYDGNDRLIRLENPDGSSIAYTYDGLGNRLTETLRASAAGSAATTTYTYDALNRIETVIDPQGRVVRYSYDAVGNLASLVYPNGVTSTYSYDANNRLRELRHANGSGDIARYVYNVNAVGDRTRVTNTVDGTFVDYAYDELRRLTRETHYNVAAVATFELRYSYDAVGNRTAQVDLSGITTMFNYDSADKLISAGSVLFAYDANGNRIERRAASAVTRYRFDAEDQLTNVQTPGADVSFAYDANGARIRRTSDPVMNYLVDPENGTGFSQVVGEYTGNELQTRYVYGDRILSRQEGADALYYHADANHNVRVLTGSSGTERDRYSYTAFGATLAASSGSANVYGFASERTESLVGLSYLRARYYDPSTGRFLSRDPYAGELRDPVSLHRYLYAHANPVAFRDPSGRVTFAEVKVSAAIGATMGALTSGIAAYAAGKRGYQIVAEMFIGAAFGAVGGAVGPALSTAFAKSRVIFSLLSNPVVAKYGARLVYAIPVTVLGLVEDLSKGLSSGDIANRGYFRDLLLVTGANLLFNTLVGPGVVEAKEVRTLFSTAAPTGRQVVSNGRQLYQIVRNASVAARQTRLATTITEFRLYAPARLTAPMEALMKFIFETTKTIVAVVPGYANPRP